MVNIKAETAEIERQMEAMEAAENRKDLDAMLAAMTEDAILQLGGAPMIQGWAAVRQVYEELFKVFVSTSITALGTRVSASGDMAWQYGTHVNTLEGPDGRVTQPGKWLCIYTNVDDQWKMAAVSIS